MRLEKPRELALALLAPQGWTVEGVERAIAAGTTRRVALTRSIPLYVIHRTVAVGDDGRIVFRPDVYGWDRKLAAALAGRPESLAQGDGATVGCGQP
jgi:murein L,D-transpeptidase YcbB/YkuD